VQADTLELRIEDNGKGMVLQQAPATTKRGHGVRNMKKRAEETVAELTIASDDGNGTVVVVRKSLRF